MRDDRQGQDDGTDAGPFRRRVFYIPGYDPFHPRRYRELYRKEGATQARLSGYDLRMLPRQGGNPHGWRVETRIDGRVTQTEIEVLVWSDLVRGSMEQGILATYGQLARTSWAYIGSGALFRLMRLRKGPVIAALYPVVMLLAQLGLGMAAGWLVWRLGALALPGWAAILPALAAVWAVLAGFRRIDNRLMAWYLMHDYAYSAQAQGTDPPDLTARMGQFAVRIREAMTEEWDEVLVVGHSSGAHIGVSVLAGLLRDGFPAPRPALSFLSLGQVVPMVSFLPRAFRLRADLAAMAAQPHVPWVDVTAPGDGCAFALCDPVAVSGVAPPDKRWPLVVSAAFTQTLRPETWARLRRRYFRLHFQYLCAFDALPGKAWDYDYFRITAGPRRLADHFGGRPASASRIERAVNRHTAMA